MEATLPAQNLQNFPVNHDFHIIFAGCGSVHKTVRQRPEQAPIVEISYEPKGLGLEGSRAGIITDTRSYILESNWIDKGAKSDTIGFTVLANTKTIKKVF